MGKCATGKAKLIRGFAFGGDPNATTGRTDRIDANGNNLALTDAMKANPTAFGAREPGAAGVNPYELGAGTTTGLSGAVHYSATDASTVAVPPAAGATQKPQIPGALAKMDQDIAMGNALGGLSNTERYQMANPDNQPYSVGAPQGRAGRGMSGMVSSATPGSAAEASQNMQRISIMSSLRDKLAAQPGFANGGKIQGPGTPTSDSLQAKVKETGEPIAVSTGERIVSKEQDVLLQKIAQGMGYDSLDALLEEGTGKPVGPTMKGGMAHASTGASLRDFSVPLGEQIKGAQAVAEKVPYVAPAPAPVNRNEILTDASARAADPELAASAGPMVRPPSSGDAGAGRGRLAPTFSDPAPVVQALSQSPEILNAPQYSGAGMSASAATEKPTAQMQPPDGGGFITNAAGKTIQLAPQAAPVRAPGAQIDANGNDMSRTNAMKVELAGMQRERLMRDMGADITSPGTRLAAQQQLAQMDKADGMAMLASKSQREDTTAGLDQQLKGQQIASGLVSAAEHKRAADLFDAYQNEPDEQKKAGYLASYNALKGKSDEYSHATGATSIDPATGMAVKSGDVIYNKRTGQSPPSRKAASPDIPNGAINMLKADPKMAAEFDKKYGAGAAKQILGK